MLFYRGMKQKLMFYGTVVLVVLGSIWAINRFLPSVSAMIFGGSTAK